MANTMANIIVFALIALIALARAQTITTTNPAGQSVVEVVTNDPILGPSTRIIQTLTTTATTTSTTATTTATAKTATTATTTAALQQGPVGQPASTTGTPGGPTPYTYTTVVNGQTTVLTDVFTPTSPSTINVTAGASGTILGYSSWLSIYGSGATAAASAGHSTVPFTWGTFFIAMIPFAFL